MSYGPGRCLCILVDGRYRQGLERDAAMIDEHFGCVTEGIGKSVTEPIQTGLDNVYLQCMEMSALQELQHWLKWPVGVQGAVGMGCEFRNFCLCITGAGNLFHIAKRNHAHWYILCCHERGHRWYVCYICCKVFRY